MTRILRLLLIVAVALPFFGTAAAQGTGSSATVCPGNGTTDFNEFVPVYGYWIDTEGVASQMLYPSTKFTGLAGGRTKQIESITFYSTANVPASIGEATVIVRMG